MSDQNDIELDGRRLALSCIDDAPWVLYRIDMRHPLDPACLVIGNKGRALDRIKVRLPTLYLAGRGVAIECTAAWGEGR